MFQCIISIALRQTNIIPSNRCAVCWSIGWTMLLTHSHPGEFWSMHWQLLQLVKVSWLRNWRDTAAQRIEAALVSGTPYKLSVMKMMCSDGWWLHFQVLHAVIMETLANSYILILHNASLVTVLIHCPLIVWNNNVPIHNSGSILSTYSLWMGS